MRRDDEIELDIAFAGREDDGVAATGPTGGDGLGPETVAEDEDQQNDESSAPRRRWHSPTPWVAVGVGLAVVGSVMAANVPPALGDAPGMIADLSQPPSLQWEAELCARDANIEVIDDVLLVLGQGCVQALDLASGTERWALDDLSGALCGHASGPTVACLAGPADSARVVTIDLATGARTERDADGVNGVVAVQDGVIESSSDHDTELVVRRVAADGAELWSRTIEVDPAFTGNIGTPFGTVGPVVVIWTAPQGRYLDVADGSDVELTWSDDRGDLAAVGPFDSERRVLDKEGQAVATLLPGQLLPSITDELEPDVILVNDVSLEEVMDLHLAAQDRSGRTLWELPVGAYPVAAVGDVVLLYPMTSGEFTPVTAFDLYTGSELWRASPDDVGMWQIGTDGVRLVSSVYTEQGQWLVATEAATGRESWRVKVGDQTSYGVYAVADDGSVVVMSSRSVAVWRAD